MNRIRATTKITGRVQGVWFRQSTKQTATACGVTGWVRNCPDGSVEAVFEGEKPQVEQAINWCRQGPQLARVDEVQIDWSDASGEFSDFEVR